MAHGPLSSETSAEARHRLRLALSRFYSLEQFDLFFAPSLHVAKVFLSQLFLRQEQARNQQRYASRYPVTELNVLPAVPLIAGSIMLVPHVELPDGRRADSSAARLPESGGNGGKRKFCQRAAY